MPVVAVDGHIVFEIETVDLGQCSVEMNGPIYAVDGMPAWSSPDLRMPTTITGRYIPGTVTMYPTERLKHQRMRMRVDAYFDHWAR